SPTLPASRMEALQLDEAGSSMSDAPNRAKGLSAEETEYCIRRPDTGETVWLSRRAEYVRDAQGRVTAMRGVVQDITKRKRAEATLRAHQAELAQLNASLEERVAQRTRDLDRVWRLATDLMLIARLDGPIQAINPAWRAQLGWEPADLIGRHFIDLIHPDDHARTMEENDRIGAGQVTRHFENRWRHRDGTYRTVAWAAVPEAGFVHAVGRDITAESAAAEALREAEERLRQSQKMEAVGQLTGGIAHDFNNLLQGISGSLEVVRKRIAQGRAAEVERHVDAALNATQKAASLTHRLLAFSRRQPLDPKPVRANPLVGSMEDLLRRTLGEHIALEMVLAEGVWTTRCDPNQLENAILNLAINARDAMPDGGTLEIETRNLQRDGQDFVCISVADTGTGMPPDVVAHAFEPFFTTKPLGQGTGLGLSMIYGFALQSEGTCHIDSEVGRGTTVTLSLPRHHGTDTREADTPPDVAPHAERGEVVLVVEDEPIVRGLIVDVLGERGYRVLTATDGPTGLARVQDAGAIDLLLTDIGLPGLDGRRLAEAARIVRPGLKVLFMTGYAHDAATAQGFLGTGMGIVTKPFTMDHLAARVRELLAAGHA
ncbi:MAG: ATP-binding protein, partial [Rhizobacter sp.]